MAGTINLALTQQLDEYGQPLAGGALYIIQAGTVATPQNAYQDSALSIMMPNPIPLDAAGRIPQFFLADGQIKVRLQDKAGVVKFTADNLLVIGPSAGGGGGGAGVDPTTVWTTGDLKVRYDTAVIAGYVRANGKTIGNSSSGATELADPSAQSLFQFLWNIDSALAVTPSRGATAAADWSASKQIALPDWRGCTLAALDDMGNSAANRLTSTYFGTSAIVLGARSGSESHTANSNEMPPHYHTASIYDQGHSHTTQLYANNGVGGGSTYVAYNALAWSSSGGSTSYPIATSTVGTGVRINSGNGLDTTSTAGGGTPFTVCQPTKLATVYIKL